MRLFPLAPLLFAFATLALAQNPATLTIDAAKPLANVSPTLYGIMTEEINYSYDGGLYAELVSNRTFQTIRGPNLEHWTLIQNGNAQANIEIDKTSGPSTALPLSLKFSTTSAGPHAEAGFYNTGYWGMALHPATTYHGSFYAKALEPEIGR
jgi:alpha-L-arabinofuranosidase